MFGQQTINNYTAVTTGEKLLYGGDFRRKMNIWWGQQTRNEYTVGTADEKSLYGGDNRREMIV